MADVLKKLWQKKRVWIILILAQFTLNLIGQIMPAGVQNVLMVLSGSLLLALSVYAVYSQRNHMLVLLLNIFLLYFNYSLVSAVYWNMGSLSNIFSGYTGAEFLASINIELVFFGVYTLLLKGEPEGSRRVYLRSYKPSYPIIVACSVYIALAPLLFYRTEAFGTRGYITALYEYALVVLVVALRFAGRDKKAVAGLLVASVWMIVHGLIHGERVLALQMMLVWGVYLLMHILSLKLIVPACVAGIFLFTVFGIYRGAKALEGNVLEHVFGTLFAGGMANDTAFYAYQAGMSIQRFAQIVSIWERIGYFLKYLLYIVLGSMIPNVNISTLASGYNPNLGGGWLPFYAYFWLDYVGVILAGGGLAWLVNRVSKLQERKHFLNYLALYVVATSPRWYLYSPASLTRGIMFFALFYGLCMLARKHVPQLWQWMKKKLFSQQDRENGERGNP